MRIFLIGLLCLFVSGTMAQMPTSYYVAAKTGLSMRDKPDVSGKVIDKIPYGTKINIIENGEERKEIVTEGIRGMWQPVKYNNKTGYIIDSYLFNYPPPKLATVKEMKNYLSQISAPFGAKLVVKSGSMASIDGGGWELQKQLYKNGAEWHQFSGYEYGSDTYFLPNFTIQQGFLLLRLIPEFKELFNEKDEFPVDSRKFTRNGVEYDVKVEKFSWEGVPSLITKITVEYAPDANYMFEMYMIDNQLVISLGSGV